jgi:hypothetical protein
MSVPNMARQYRAWLLGGSAAAAALAAAGVPVAYAESKKDKDKDGSPYFDPDALERGAKALREINASPHAKQVCVCVCGARAARACVGFGGACGSAVCARLAAARARASNQHRP